MNPRKKIEEKEIASKTNTIQSETEKNILNGLSENGVLTEADSKEINEGISNLQNDDKNNSSAKTLEEMEIEPVNSQTDAILKMAEAIENGTIPEELMKEIESTPASITEELSVLSTLYKSGMITEEEFERIKKDILTGMITNEESEGTKKDISSGMITKEESEGTKKDISSGMITKEESEGTKKNISSGMITKEESEGTKKDISSGINEASHMNPDIKFKNSTFKLILLVISVLVLFLLSLSWFEYYWNYESYNRFGSDFDEYLAGYTFSVIAVCTVFLGIYVYRLYPVYKYRNIFSKHKITSLSDLAKIVNKSEQDVKKELMSFLRKGYITGIKVYDGKFVFPYYSPFSSTGEYASKDLESEKLLKADISTEEFQELHFRLFNCNDEDIKKDLNIQAEKVYNSWDKGDITTEEFQELIVKLYGELRFFRWYCTSLKLKTYDGKIILPNRCELTSFVRPDAPLHIKTKDRQRLRELHEQGLITDGEFEQAEGQLLGSYS